MQRTRLAFGGAFIQDVRHMNSVVSDKPYVPVPPYHGTLWLRVLGLYFPRYLRRRYGVTKVEIVGADKLRASISAGHRALGSPDHCAGVGAVILCAFARGEVES